MKWGVVTLFPEMVESALSHGVIGRGLRDEVLSLAVFNPRDYATDVHQSVDDRPYGGGPGMLMQVATLRGAIATAKKQLPKAPVVYLSPQGEPLKQPLVAEFATVPELIVIAGRYEGIDERVIALDVDREVSIGDFVLSGGEPAAIAMLDAIGRLVPGVLGSTESASQDSFSAGLLDHPHYTRPEQIDGYAVPDVLLSGHHGAIARWRRKEAIGRTWQRRPDLLAQCDLSSDDKVLLEEFIKESRR
jgi:tRNA (guanine37-N1)-methyltransferase